MYLWKVTAANELKSVLQYRYGVQLSVNRLIEKSDGYSGIITDSVIGLTQVVWKLTLECINIISFAPHQSITQYQFDSGTEMTVTSLLCCIKCLWKEKKLLLEVWIQTSWKCEIHSWLPWVRAATASSSTRSLKFLTKTQKSLLDYRQPTGLIPNTGKIGNIHPRNEIKCHVFRWGAVSQTPRADNISKSWINSSMRLTNHGSIWGFTLLVCVCPMTVPGFKWL